MAALPAIILDPRDAPVMQLRTSSLAGPQFQVISLNDSNPQIREYKRRKPHKKTKAGCASCKKKRVKCDLARPICLRCQRNQRHCVYDRDDDDDGPATPAPPRSRQLVRASRPNFRCLNQSAFPVTGPEYGTSPDFLLHHFNRSWSELFDMPIFTGSLMPMALRYPHVKYTILAVAAAHLRHKVPALTKEHRLAEHFQQSLAISSYQSALATPLAVHGQAGTDSLLMTAMLMNMLAFALPMEEDAETGEPDPAKSWVFSPNEDRLGWLAVQMGLSPLLVATRPWREKSFLAPIFRNSDDERRTLSGTWQTLNRVPVTWTTLFGLNRQAPEPTRFSPISDNDRLFRAPLRVLAEIRELEPSRRNMLRYFQIIGHLENEFRLLMYYRDEKALWAFGMWLGLMCRFEGVWWVDKRARRDFKAIRMWLHQAAVERRPGQEGRLWKELLKDMDATCDFQFNANLFK